MWLHIHTLIYKALWDFPGKEDAKQQLLENNLSVYVCINESGFIGVCVCMGAGVNLSPDISGCVQREGFLNY